MRALSGRSRVQVQARATFFSFNPVSTEYKKPKVKKTECCTKTGFLVDLA